MADLSPIQNLLDDIKNAIYGEQVRTAIHDSIARCYTDVDDSKTLSVTAAEQATNAAASANLATNAANNAASKANAATASANEAIDNANSVSDRAEVAIGRIDQAISNAEDATANANSAASEATNSSLLASRATTAANNAATNATNATTNANAATASANEAAENAREATNDTIAATTDCNNARSNTVLATSQANNAATRANTAAASIEQLSVTFENVGPDAAGSASISDLDNHKNIHFRLKQGAQGAPYIIKGNAYPSVDALASSVENPNVGDQYNVGSEPPYNVYRWTGTTWENQGKIGMSISNLENSEVDLIWNESEVDSENSKYLNHRGLFYLVVNKIKSALSSKVDKVEGKALSSNDFTDSYVSLISDHSDAITALDTLKVDKISGKSLSTNDFTNTYKNQITANQTAIGSATLKTSAQTVKESINEVYDIIEDNASLTNIRTYSSVTQLGGVAGQAILQDVYDAMPAPSIGTFSANDFNSDQRPVTNYVGSIIIYKVSSLRSAVFAFGRDRNGLDYRKFLSTDGTSTLQTEWIKIPQRYTSLAQLGLSDSTASTTSLFNAMSDGTEAYLPLEANSALANELGFTSYGGSLWLHRFNKWRVMGEAVSYNGRSYRFAFMGAGVVPSWSDPIEYDVNGGFVKLDLTSDFKAYNNYEPYIPRYRKSGKMVYVYGVVMPTAEISASDSGVTIATLPSFARPAMAVQTVCQGSAMNRWLFTISTDGTMTLSRYGTTAISAVPANAWLPFNVAFMTN